MEVTEGGLAAFSKEMGKFGKTAWKILVQIVK
jgi:hypothetical protein